MPDDNLAVSYEQPATADADFDAIHDAFMDTGRGRWFLNEYSRRNRHADTALLLAAIGRIESILLAQRAASSLTQQAAPANPQAIKPEVEPQGKGGSNAEAAQIAAECAARLRASLAPLQGVAWTLREQGDMRADVIDRQSAEIAEAANLFDLLCARLLTADADRPIADDKLQTAQDESGSTAAEFVPPEISAEPAQEAVQPPSQELPEEAPPPIRTFATHPLLDELPPSVADTPSRSPRADGEAEAFKPLVMNQDDAEFSFQELFEEANASNPHTETAENITIEPRDEPAQVAPAELAREQTFELVQEQRLSRLIHLFAGSNGLELKSESPRVVQLVKQDATVSKAATPPEIPGTVREPWPRAPMQDGAPSPSAQREPPAARASPAAYLPIDRATPHDPLAPITALSAEEKIALFS